MGQSPPGSTYNDAGYGLPFYQGVKDFDYRHPVPRVYCSKPKRVAQTNDILISVRAPIGRVNVADIPCAIGRGLAVIRPYDADDTRYLEYLLRHIEGDWMVLEGGGSVFGNATKKDLHQLRVRWPYQEERQAIANVLGTLDDRIAMNRQMNETLEEMARALFKSWFVDFDPVRAKVEDRWKRGESRHGLPAELYDLFPDSLIESGLGPIPEGWKVGTLGGMVQLLSGGTPKTSVPEYWNGDIPWYTAKDAPVPSDIFVIETERNVTPDGVANSATRILPRHTTVVTARGTVGKLACLGKPMAMNQTCYGIRGDKGLPDHFTYFNVKLTLDQLRKKTHGTIFDTITRQTFGIIDAVVPPLVVAKSFETKINPLMRQILLNLHVSQILSTLRDTALPKLLSGECSTFE